MSTKQKSKFSGVSCHTEAFAKKPRISVVQNKRIKRFREQFAGLPAHVQQAARKRFHRYFQRDPNHPLLKRHDLHDVSDAPKGSFAVEIFYGYRAVAFYDRVKECYVWYWCGSHADYDTQFRKGR